MTGGLFGTSPTCHAEFRAAAIRMDITPKTPQWLHGYAPRQSTGVHDPIYHRILALQEGTNRLYLVASDICTLVPSYCDEVLGQLEKETGIPAEEVWWTCTHTHAAPHVGPQLLGPLFQKTLGNRFFMQHDTNHWNFVNEQLKRGIVAARKALEPARLGISIGEAQANVNRRERTPEGRIRLGVNPDGPVDRQLGVIKLERTDGSLLALVANYAIHGTTYNGRNTQISGDIPGQVARQVEDQSGVPVLFVNGAEGNVAPLHSVGTALDSPRVQEMRDHLTARILELANRPDITTSEISLGRGRTNIETPRREGLGWVKEMEDYEGRTQEGQPTVRIPVRSLVINDSTVIWGAPLELFSEIAMNIRRDSPFENTLYFGLTHGSLLYMPTRVAFEEGGYEVGVSPFTPQAEEDFTGGVSKYLRELKP